MIAIESYRQAIRNNRLLSKLLIAMLIVVIALVSAIVIILPLKTTEYLFYEFSDSGKTFYRIGSADKLVDRKNALIRFAARRYIYKRETIDRLTEQDRFIEVQQMSNNQVFEDFKTSYNLVSGGIGDGGKRVITIELDNAFNNDFASNVHIVEFETEDRSATGEVVKKYWKAVIGYQFNEQKLRLDDLVQNPLGFEVTSYTINKRNPLNKVK